MRSLVRSLVTVASLGAVVGLVACTAPVGEGSRSSGEPIVNGTTQGEEDSTVVKIYSSRGPDIASCTGVLLTNDWALTAKHCFVAADLAQPYLNVKVAMGDNVSMIALIVPHPTLDVVLMLLLDPFEVNGSTLGYLRLLDTRAPSAFAGSNLDCWGYGFSSFSQNVGLGALRSATLPVTGAQSSLIVLGPNASGQALWKGDSGGPCFSSSGLLAGVISQGNTLGTGWVIASSEITDLLAQKVPQFGFDLSAIDPGVDPSTGTDECAAAQTSCDEGDALGYWENAASCVANYGVLPTCSLPQPPRCAPLHHWCAPFERNGTCQPGYCLAAYAMCMSGPACGDDGFDNETDSSGSSRKPIPIKGLPPRKGIGLVQ